MLPPQTQQGRPNQTIPLVPQPGVTPEIGQGPPYLFSDVIFQVFPLRADPIQLQALVDAYLNILPPEISFFRVNAPFVYLILSHYGRMGRPSNYLGFLSQTEVVFSIPISRFRMQDGRAVYCDSGSVAPLLFVSDIFALMTGRELFGWQKFPGRFQPTIQPWEWAPNAKNPVVSLGAGLDPDMGSDSETPPFLKVEVDPTWNPWQWPTPTSPLLAWPQHISKNISAWLEDMSQLMGQDWQSSQPFISPQKLNETRERTQPFEWMSRLANLTGWPPIFQMRQNSYTLKQFRSAQQAQNACYQAVIRSETQVQRLKGAGLLGGNLQSLGDLSGGFQVSLRFISSQPVLRALGLVADHWLPANRDPSSPSTFQAPSSFPQGDRDVAILKPVLPFWARFDFTYRSSEVVAWRNQFSAWFVERGQHSIPVGPSNPRGNPFNECLGNSPLQPNSPIAYLDTTWRILRLPGNRQILQDRCNQLNFRNSPYRFSLPEGPCSVYLLVQSAQRMLTSAQHIVPKHLRGVDLVFRAVWSYRPPDGGALQRGYIQLPIFSFTDQPMAAVLLRDMVGLPTSAAHIRSPRDTWLDAHRNQPRMQLLVPDLMSVSVSPVPLQVPLIEVIRPIPTQTDTSVEGREPLTVLPEDEPLLKGLEKGPLSIVTLKQVPSLSGSFTKAAFQSLVQVILQFRRPRVQTIREVQHLRIYWQPSFPLLDYIETKTGRGGDAPPDRQRLQIDRSGSYVDLRLPEYQLIRSDYLEWNGNRVLMHRDGQTPWQPASQPLLLDGFAL